MDGMDGWMDGWMDEWKDGGVTVKSTECWLLVVVLSSSSSSSSYLFACTVM